MIHSREDVDCRRRLHLGAFFIIFAKEICMIRTVGRGVFEKDPGEVLI